MSDPKAVPTESREVDPEESAFESIGYGSTGMNYQPEAVAKKKLKYLSRKQPISLMYQEPVKERKASGGRVSKRGGR